MDEVIEAEKKISRFFPEMLTSPTSNNNKGVANGKVGKDVDKANKKHNQCYGCGGSHKWNDCQTNWRLDKKTRFLYDPQGNKGKLRLPKLYTPPQGRSCVAAGADAQSVSNKLIGPPPAMFPAFVSAKRKRSTEGGMVLHWDNGSCLSVIPTTIMSEWDKEDFLHS